MVKLILSDYDRCKVDNNKDEFFYKDPKFVFHLDHTFRKKVTALAGEIIRPNSLVLDLMTSWFTYLPSEIKYNKVIGHGMNSEELRRNKVLDNYWIQDFNVEHYLPLDDNSFDYVIIVAGWQYLQYPEYLAFELKRVIKNKGKLIVAFSNRAFWNKTPRIWYESNSNQRLGYIERVLRCQGWDDILMINQENQKRLFGLFDYNTDPFYAVLATS